MTNRQPPSGHALVEDDAQIAAALQDAHVPTLAAALAYLTGDAGLVRQAGKLTFGYLGDHQGGMAPELQARVRAAALQALARHRDAGCPALQPRPDAFVRELMDFVAGQPIAEHYLPFLREELALDGCDAKARASLVELPAAQRAGFRVIVIGAGMSGIAAAVRLRQAGVSFVVVEKNADVGGTWLENSYPGCRVDSPNHLYSFSFAPHDWPQHYSTQAALLGYFRRVVDEHRLREHIRFRTAVEEAVWDEAAAVWRVRVRDAGGAEETLVGNAVISAVGQLNRPLYPNIPGRERFAGAAFHSACWDHGYDLAGKRVAVIGTGASAFQFVPEIAGKTRELLVFQRSAPWLAPTPNYHDPVPDGMKWLLRKVPNYDKWYRFWLFWLSTDGLMPAVTADPEWRGSARAVSAANDLLRKLLKGYIRSQVGDDPELFAAAVPDYPPGGKRMLRDHGAWLAALKRDDVQLVTTKIAAISDKAVITEDGVAHEVDAIIYGTGFQASRFLQPMRVSGRNGIGLNDQWAGDARAYLGMTVPAFPNLFLMYGPNTNIVVNGSIIFFSECEVRYVLGCIELLLRGGHRAMEVRREPHDRYNEKLDAQNARMAWGAAGVRSWYKNANGRVSQNWPFPLVDFWSATQAPDPGDFDVW